MSEARRSTEWFTWVDANTINYKFTVEEPSTFTGPWTAEMPFLASNGPIFEHAYDQGNRDTGNILSTARVLEKKGADAKEGIELERKAKRKGAGSIK